MFSVLMSIYNGEKVDYFRQSMESVLNQSLKASEIILIRDGLVYKELQDLIDYYVGHYNVISYYHFEENMGLGKALNYGVSVAKNEIIMRMDTDDIALYDRFEKQYNYLIDHPEVDVLGGQIEEFDTTPDVIVSKRNVPIENKDIYKFFKKRNALNHMTVAFRKKKVMECGNYQDLRFLEDYYLWCRMIIKKSVFHNLEDILVYARIGRDMFKRRGGMSYYLAWRKLEKFKLKNRIINVFTYIKTLSLRFIVQVVFPTELRGFVLKKFARVKSK